MVSAQPAVGSLPRGGRAVAADANESNFERLSALFELGAERSAIALVSATALSALPTLTGALASRFSLHPIDLTLDEDPYADLTELPRGRVLVGLSLLSPERMRERLGRLNRGRDRIHALGLHIVVVVVERDVSAVLELAPDLASRVHELLHFELEPPHPVGALVLSPLGPVRRPEQSDAHPLEGAWMARVQRSRSSQIIRLASEQLSASAAGLAWRFATTEQSWVAWLESRWDPSVIDRWLEELGGARLLVVIVSGDQPLPKASSRRISAAYFFGLDGPRAERGWIELCPEPLPTATNPEPRHHRERHGELLWLVHADADSSSANELADALAELGCGVLASEVVLDRGGLELIDATVILLSPAALGSSSFAAELQRLHEFEPAHAQARTIVLLDRVSASAARERVGSEAVLLSHKPAADAAHEISRVIQTPKAEAKSISTPRTVNELVVELREDALAEFTSSPSLEGWRLVTDAELRSFGRALHDIAIDGDTRGYDRVIIESDDLAVHELPWEAMCDAQGFLSDRGIIVARRAPRVELRRSSRSATDVLRVLLIVASPDDQPVFDPRMTATLVSDALARLGMRAEMHVLVRPTFAEVASTLANADARGQGFQIVHYDGHGYTDGGRACLAFEGEGHVSIERFGWELRDQRIELCILDLHDEHAAESAPARALALLSAGACRVLALDFRLLRSHELFVHELYGRLAAGYPPDRALQAARLRVRLRDDEVSDWFRPILFEADVEHVPLIEPIPTTDPRRELDHPIPAYAKLDSLADYERLLALDELLRRERALVVYGPGELDNAALAADFARWQLQMQRFHRVLWFGQDDANEAGETIDALAEILRRRDVLVVIDELDAWPDTHLLDRLAEFPYVRVLATSRAHPRALGLDLPAFAFEELPSWADKLRKPSKSNRKSEEN